jgi:prepilin-type processing-associated H-X9-DG protein
MGDNEGLFYGFKHDSIRFGDLPPLQDGPGNTPTTPVMPFGSSHPGAMNVAFADGSVRSVLYSVSYEAVWKLICNRNNKFPVDTSDIQ